MYCSYLTDSNYHSNKSRGGWSGEIVLRMIALICLSGISACATIDQVSDAQALLEPKSGSSVSGTVKLSRLSSGVLLVVDVGGLQPNHMHGFHVHEKGDCSAPDAASAGGHFNPEHTLHGSPMTDSNAHHLGDLPALKSDLQGHAFARITLPTGSLDPANAHNLLGRSLVVHRDLDDYISQPAGNSGPRVACGVILNGVNNN